MRSDESEVKHDEWGPDDYTKPQTVRDAVKAARNALKAASGFLPANIFYRLDRISAELTKTELAIDVWESELRLSAVQESEGKHEDDVIRSD